MKTRVIACIALINLIAASADAQAQLQLPGFERSRHFGEQVRSLTFEPDVRVVINAPSAQQYRPEKPVRLILYALPNGNTIEQTEGRKLTPQMDWHYDIQHIGAQIRHLRELIDECNLVVAYLEAEGLSWPAWRRSHHDPGAQVLRLIESLQNEFPDSQVTVDLASHSGGGSLIIALLEHVERIPDRITRIVFLDSNYGYRDEGDHAAKLIQWLQHGTGRLFVAAYDDREVRFNGKKIVGPDGGTFRRTVEMVDRFGQVAPLESARTDEYRRFRCFDGRAEFVLLDNPDNRILHTVMVERNGLIHALTFGTNLEAKAGDFFADRAYVKWIQED